MVCSVASIALIAFTLGTHRHRLALWHQTNDAPEHLVTYGAIRRLRHPFYTAFLLALLAALLACPHVGTAATLWPGYYNYTAAQEEQRLVPRRSLERRIETTCSIRAVSGPAGGGRRHA